ncbi:MAG: lipoyl(octanoyl) transferase LipB [Dehalococcoidia bacterium]|nr:lipoyl(octanoyl) transferase LipB [Dehalococcoidia bacterium]
MGTRCTLLRPGLTDYQRAWRLQRRLADAVRAGGEPALILLEHPPTYTLGARGAGEHLLLSREALAAGGASVIESDRGGDVTFHGPGQLVAYPIFDLRRFGLGPVSYVRGLEAVCIATVGCFGVVAGRVAGRPGVWVRGTGGRPDAKIAAIGVRVSRGVTTHGFALNVNTDLRWFDHIVPCGIRDAGVTSLRETTGAPAGMAAVEDALIAAFAAEFGLAFVEDAPAVAVETTGRQPELPPCDPRPAVRDEAIEVTVGR